MKLIRDRHFKLYEYTHLGFLYDYICHLLKWCHILFMLFYVLLLIPQYVMTSSHVLNSLP